MTLQTGKLTITIHTIVQYLKKKRQPDNEIWSVMEYKMRIFLRTF